VKGLHVDRPNDPVERVMTGNALEKLEEHPQSGRFLRYEIVHVSPVTRATRRGQSPHCLRIQKQVPKPMVSLAAGNPQDERADSLTFQPWNLHELSCDNRVESPSEWRIRTLPKRELGNEQIMHWS